MIIMKNTDVTRNQDTTILKHWEIYEHYKKLCDVNRQKYPEVAGYIARNYYYNILSREYSLTRNYVCAIICNIVNDENKFYYELQKARMNIEADREIM